MTLSAMIIKKKLKKQQSCLFLMQHNIRLFAQSYIKEIIT